MTDKAIDPTNVLVPKCQACGSFSVLDWPGGGKHCGKCSAVWDGTHKGIYTPPLATPLNRLR